MPPPSDPKVRIADYIEQYYKAHAGEVPPDPDILHYAMVYQEELNEARNSGELELILEERGIFLTPNRGLTPEQLACATAVLNPYDKRSRARKLADFGITTSVWQAWMKQPSFRAYVDKVSEHVLAEAKHDADLGLVKGLESGSIKHIEYYNEMMGRYDRTLKGQVNVALLFQRLFDIIQRHVTDPVTLRNIGEELQQLVEGTSRPPVEALPKAISGDPYHNF